MASSHISNEIPVDLQSGIDAVKWPEDSKKPSNPSNVHLSIDTKGFYLTCRDQNTNGIECFDITLIHDVRTGSQNLLPRGAEQCRKVNIGTLGDPLLSKWLTINYGDTFVPSPYLRTIHFSCKSRKIAEEWTKQLFYYGHNQRLRNLSSLECLEKFHSKIINSLINFDTQTISVRKLIQFLCDNSRDNNKENKIRQTLEYLKLPYGIDATIDKNQFTFDIFFRFYMRLMDRPETDDLFKFIDKDHHGYLSLEDMKEFIKKQNDAPNDRSGRNNYEQQAEDFIKKYTRHEDSSKEIDNLQGMYYESFLKYLLSFDNLIIDPTKLNLFMDMDKPLAHYFISSSHNTYLAGSQWTGRASIDMYRYVLLTGCRCIELDVVDGESKNDEPEIKHIYTPVKPVRFIDVIVAIREYAFKVTPYPLILSIENHCGPKAQAKMAQYFVDIFGAQLLTEPLKSHPCDGHYPLPSPNDLKYKILIKNKKLHQHSSSKINNQNTPIIHKVITPSNSDPSTDTSTASSSSTRSSNDSLRLNPRNGILLEDENLSDEERIMNELDPTNEPIPESKATKAMSDLVHYTVPVRFATFVRAQELNRSYEMSSFSEDKGQNAIRDYANDFLIYNQRQLSRIYPRGTRFDSSNYNPYIFWPIGCQMVALNYQTLDIPMQLNLGLFSFNDACGYIEKPSVLCDPRQLFDPRIRKNIENVVSCEVHIKVLSGQFFCQSREPAYVDIHMYGMYGDTSKRHERRILVKQWNGFQAIYGNTNLNSNALTTKFLNIILPEMASLRFAVSADDGTFIGQCFIPVAYLRPGYHHIPLRNKINILTCTSSLFIFIEKKIYVNDKDQEFVNRLINPLQSQSHNLNTEDNDQDIISLNRVTQSHNSIIKELEENIRPTNPSMLFDKTNWYQTHAIAGSAFHNRNCFCRIRSVNDIKPEEVLERNRMIESKLQQISIDYQKDLDQSKQALIHLYTKKFQKQQYLEYELITQYYNEFETKIQKDFKAQLSNIGITLENEKSLVEDSAKSQIKQEANQINQAETNKNRISLLTDRSLQTNAQIVRSTMNTLEKMSEQVKEVLQINLRISLHQLEERKRMEIEKCLEKYSSQFNDLENRLQRLIHNDEYNISQNNSPLLYDTRMTSASLSNVYPYSPSENLTTSQLQRRQTTD
ncbi:unnamed protein product [Adineta steineri]|uniref:1-phosphatidylinositol 4,5-bisphosphate phosphodiesterase n=1 Tax=Adineta steineri TaxID=433720 RepID=A0A813RWM3_9BILA|nr:unnamed protein product [Adineta steineri]CAF0892740.1 unnamed protein product [Adineta steineri]